MKIPGINTYYGGKAGSGTYQKIINQIRPCDTLVVPFMGNCGVTRHIQRPGRVLGNDLDKSIVEAWSAARIPGVEVYQGEALDFLARVLSWELGRVVVYCDPPYPFKSRKSGRKVYKSEMGGEKEHAEFLDAAKFLRVDCLISTYPNEQYEAALSSWRRVEFQSQTRAGMATEWLFMNYPEPVVLHDDSYAGGNYREREYIKRKAARWLAKYRALGAAEQQVILAELVKTTPKELILELTSAPVTSHLTVAAGNVGAGGIAGSTSKNNGARSTSKLTVGAGTLELFT